MTPTVIPTTTAPKKQQISDLISHLAKSDNHLWVALTSLQAQANAIVGNTSDWCSWNPKIADNTGAPLATSNVIAFYMTIGNLLFIQLHGQVTVNSSANALQVSLPDDIGQILIKTCTAYLMQATSPTDNGIIGVEAQQQLATLTIKPSFRSLTCTFMMGGSLGII